MTPQDVVPTFIFAVTAVFIIVYQVNNIVILLRKQISNQEKIIAAIAELSKHLTNKTL
jgi:hypothetical protein